MSNENNCPACGEKIKSNILSTNYLYTEKQCSFVSEMFNKQITAGCSKCLGDLYGNAIAELGKQQIELRKKLQLAMQSVPIITAQAPVNWHYTAMGLVTGQSTTGTGAFSELASSWTDFFGLQSAAYNNKIAAGEMLCMEQLRAKTIQLGGNAIIAADIDYSELGGLKGMIMVCMSGTAIKIENLDILTDTQAQGITNIDRITSRIRQLESDYGSL